MTNILKSWRKQNGLTQTEAAQPIGVTHVIWHRWEKGQRVPAERVNAVSMLTGIPREQIRPDIFEVAQ